MQAELKKATPIRDPTERQKKIIQELIEDGQLMSSVGNRYLKARARLIKRTLDVYEEDLGIDRETAFRLMAAGKICPPLGL